MFGAECGGVLQCELPKARRCGVVIYYLTLLKRWLKKKIATTLRIAAYYVISIAGSGSGCLHKK